MSTKPITLTIAGVEYVAIPTSEYAKLIKPDHSAREAIEEGVDWASRNLASALEKARTTAGLSQEDLAKKLGKTLDKVKRAESGAEQVGQKFVRAVLKACGLPKDWSTSDGKPPAKKAPKKKPASASPVPAKKAATKKRATRAAE